MKTEPEIRIIIDDLELNWPDFDIESIYTSSRVIFYSMEDIMRMSGWGEMTVRKLFYDRRFPSQYFGRAPLVESTVHTATMTQTGGFSAEPPPGAAAKAAEGVVPSVTLR